MTPLERAARAAQGVIDEARKWGENPAEHSEKIARAVLQAIREPSEGMERAGYGNSKGDPDNTGIIDNPAPIVAWQAMIDAALEEG